MTQLPSPQGVPRRIRFGGGGGGYSRLHRRPDAIPAQIGRVCVAQSVLADETYAHPSWLRNGDGLRTALVNLDGSGQGVLDIGLGFTPSPLGQSEGAPPDGQEVFPIRLQG